MSAAVTSSAQPVGEWKVQVYLYDLGMARAMSQQFLGKQIDGIWHTGVVVYGREYFFGGGIQASMPGQSMAGRPQTVIDMGYTRIPPAAFHDFLTQVSHRFTAATYHLLEHNCNNFSNEVSIFLTGKPIPSYITGLPAEALATPFGQMLRPMIEQMQGQMRGGGGAAGAFGQPWGGEVLNLPRGLDNLRPDRLVEASSNPSAPHNMVESAAALAAQAIAQTNAGAPPAAAAATASAAAAASASAASSASLVSVLNRSGPAKPLTSADKKARSFQVLVKANSKKPGGTPLTPTDEATLTELVTALSGEGAATQVNNEACDMMDKFVQQWAPALQFPVLGILRLMVLRPECASFYQSRREALVARLLSFLPTDDEAAAAASTPAPAPAQAMALCTLANLFSLPDFATTLHASAPLWSAVRASSSSDNSTVRLMSATLAYNAVTALPKDESDAVVEAATFMAERVGSEAGAEVAARMLIALTELANGNESMASLLVGIEFAPTLQAVASKFSADAQVQHTVKEMQTLLNKAQQSAFQVQ